MASERQILANRANAKKSTGPRSKEGKRKSSRNSARHGILARTVVLDGESHDRFTTLLAALKDELQPQTGIEYTLVENMAVARWRQMRLWGLEKAGMVHEMKKQELAATDHQVVANGDAVNRDAPTRAALAFRTLSDDSRSLELMNRYETRFDRQYSRSLECLFRMREKGDFSKRTQFSPDS